MTNTRDIPDHDGFLPHWALSPTEVLEDLRSDRQGLASDEVARRQRRSGPNVIPERRRLSKTRIVLNQLKSPLILLLAIAAGVTVVMDDRLEAGVILAAIAVNAGLGFWQENKAETVLAALSKYIRIRARVRRDGLEHVVDAAELVVGDIVSLSQGDRVPADIRLLSTTDCSADESVLTGESLPVRKRPAAVAEQADVADRTSMLHGGTLVSEGLATGVVVRIGNETAFGRIADLLAHQRPEPGLLQKAVARFSVVAGVAISILAAILFAAGLLEGVSSHDMFVLAVAVAVSAVPEGLPVALTVILAIGVERLAKRGGVVRKLLAAETLGATSLILTDKTGTLTEARMSLSAVLPHESTTQTHLLEDAILATGASVENPYEKVLAWRVIGKPMEAALVLGAGHHGVRLPDVQTANEPVERKPFSSEAKMSLVTVRRDGMLRTVMLGAPEVVVRSTDLDAAAQGHVLKVVEERAGTGERLLAVAERDGEMKEAGTFRFLGTLALRDPIRPGVMDAIGRIRASGVKTVIVTGDHPGTAKAVADELGLLKGGKRVMTSDELASMSDEALEQALSRVAVYARVTPEQKMRIVDAYRRHGDVVAVTGDGVNDAPALERADIGIAVGSGTEVAKSAADLVILGDDFSTIVAAIEEGRRILENIRKVIVYLLSNSLNEIFLIGGALLIGLPLPLNALQILYVNFFSDSFPTIAFAFEKGLETDVASRPRRVHRSLLDSQMRIFIFVVGALTSAVLFVIYWYLLRVGHPLDLVRTFIFTTFATYTLFVAFALRSLRVSILQYSPFSNRLLTLGVGIGVVLTLMGIYVPFMQRILGTVALPLPWLGAVVAVGLFNVLVVEVAKLLTRRFR
ncbi:HAD-IC family P-type ATPase [Patescibacteria group bacterium]|nr:HAD-IC family P-type ATPase [Patescibacteria group bacterium]MBU1448576.1 HAD-IC family P-type ATPase [Patescibacteria group bacterium]MBU2613023.1 HAD-IC family P-type ATPase [Patescibacteria group bacterium]